MIRKKKRLIRILCIGLILCLNKPNALAGSLFDKLTTPAPPPTEAPVYYNIDIFGLLSTATPVPSLTPWSTPSPTAEPTPLPEGTVQPSQEVAASSSPSSIEEESREREEEIREGQDTIERELDNLREIQDAAQTDSASSGMIGMMLTTATPRPTQIPHPGETYLAPSYGKMAKQGADKATQNADGSVSVVYCHVTEEDFQRFGAYLGELEYSVAEQKMEGNKLSLWLKKAPIEFDLVYEMDSQTLTLIYPSGTDYERPPATPTPTPTPVPTPTSVPTTAPTKNPNALDPVDEDCPYCHGLGICSKCMGSGDCNYCYGLGGESCYNCIGGRCIECGGTGQVYRSIGLDVKQVRCTACNSGRCRKCGGTGQIKCSYCNGTGHCTLCRGSRKCQYCNGTGKKN